MSYNVGDPLGDQEPRILWTPSQELYSSGPEVIQLAESAGLILDPWEQFVITEALREKPDGRWMAKEVGCVVSRQNGKGVILEALELASLFLLDEEVCIHSAHQLDTAMLHYNRILGVIRSTPDLAKRVLRTPRSHGDEGIEVDRGDGILRQLRFRTRSGEGGRGWTADRLVFDEAMILDDRLVGALFPILSAVDNPQLVYTGSAGMKDSRQLGHLRTRALRRNDPGLVYMEWSVEPCNEFCQLDCTEHDQAWYRDDPSASLEEVAFRHQRMVRSYQRANPGLGIRLSVEFSEQERRSMPEEEFNRERLGIGDWPIEVNAWQVVSKMAWVDCIDPLSRLVDPPFVFGIDTTPDRSRSAIVVAGIGDANSEAVHIEITSDRHGDLDHRVGTRWVVPRVKDLVQRWKPIAVVIDPASFAREFIDPLENDGIEILKPNTREVAEACGTFESNIVARAIVHRDQVSMTAAAAGIAKRKVGTDMWAWSRPGSAVDISPFVAATLAAWGFRKKTGRKPSEPWALVRGR